MHICPAQAQDLPDILDLECSSSVYGWTEKNIRDSFQSGHLIFKLLKGTDLIGYCVLIKLDNEMELLNLTILSAFQSKGVGFFFLSELFNRKIFNQISRVFLEVRKGNLAAFYLYKKIGFKPSGLRKNYYKGGEQREDAILMELCLFQDERPIINC